MLNVSQTRGLKNLNRVPKKPEMTVYHKFRIKAKNLTCIFSNWKLHRLRDDESHRHGVLLQNSTEFFHWTLGSFRITTTPFAVHVGQCMVSNSKDRWPKQGNCQILKIAHCGAV